MVDIVECNNFLIEFEEVNFIGFDFFNYILACLLWPSCHSDSCHFEVVGHGKLRIPVETNVLALLSISYFLESFRS